MRRRGGAAAGDAQRSRHPLALGLYGVAEVLHAHGSLLKLSPELSMTIYSWAIIPATLYICIALMLALLVGIVVGLESLLRPRR